MRPRWRRPPLRRSVSAKPWTGMLWTARLPKEKPSAGMVLLARSQKQDTRRETQRNTFYRCAAAAASSHLLEMVTAAVAAQSGRTGATRSSRELWRPLSSSPPLCLHTLVAAETALGPSTRASAHAVATRTAPHHHYCHRRRGGSCCCPSCSWPYSTGGAAVGWRPQKRGYGCPVSQRRREAVPYNRHRGAPKRFPVIHGGKMGG